MLLPVTALASQSIMISRRVDRLQQTKRAPHDDERFQKQLKLHMQYEVRNVSASVVFAIVVIIVTRRLLKPNKRERLSIVSILVAMVCVISQLLPNMDEDLQSGLRSATVMKHLYDLRRQHNAKLNICALLAMTMHLALLYPSRHTPNTPPPQDTTNTA